MKKKIYSNYIHQNIQPEDVQQQIIRETFHLLAKRDDSCCNFLESGRCVVEN